jgi:hypothetical protein
MVVDFVWVFWWPLICEVVSRVTLADWGLWVLCDLLLNLGWRRCVVYAIHVD